MYPYQAGDRVALGIITWDDGASDAYRYFETATVIANDRDAGVMVIESDEPHAGGHGYETLVWSLEDGGFEGGEVVRLNQSLPSTKASARILHANGTHPDQEDR